MAYRLPEKRFNKVVDKLEEEGLTFEEFIDKTIDLYLSGKINPKLDTEGWGDWMEKK